MLNRVHVIRLCRTNVSIGYSYFQLWNFNISSKVENIQHSTSYFKHSNSLAEVSNRATAMRPWVLLNRNEIDGFEHCVKQSE